MQEVSEGICLLDLVHKQAVLTRADTIVVTSESRVVGRYCKEKAYNFFPSSEKCRSGTHRCAEVAYRFNPAAKVGNVVCWPVTEPSLLPQDVDRMIAEHTDEVISTMTRPVPIASIPEFVKDPSKVKLRALNKTQVDFTRCPLPMSQHHIGVYMFSLAGLIHFGAMELTKLSLMEQLEQLTWIQYGHEYSERPARFQIHSTTSSWKEHVSVRSLADIKLLKSFLTNEEKV